MPAGRMNSEVGPVVVPKGWDYAAASMRKLEMKEGGKVRRSEGWKMRK